MTDLHKSLTAEIDKLRAQLTDVRRVVIQWDEDQIDGNSAMTSIKRIVPAADPASDPQGIEQLRARLAGAAGTIRYLADDARGLLDPRDPGNARGRIHERHADALDRILEGEDDGLRERALKEAGTWSFQARWKDGDTNPEAAAYRDDLALLNDVLRATRSEA